MPEKAAHVILVPGAWMGGWIWEPTVKRLRAQVAGIIHIGAFLPVDAHALLDNWGTTDDERAQEKAYIEAAGNLWLAPTREMLDYVDDLTDADRDYLASKFTAHPGRTVLDAAHLSSPVEERPATYVALSLKDDFDAAWEDAPAVAKSASSWHRRSLVSGRWPMLSAFDETVMLIEEEIRRYGRSA